MPISRIQKVGSCVAVAVVVILVGLVAYSVWDASKFPARLDEAARQAGRQHKQKFSWDKVTRENFEKIEIGMSVLEACNILYYNGVEVEATQAYLIEEYYNGPPDEYTSKIVITYGDGTPPHITVAKKQWVDVDRE